MIISRTPFRVSFFGGGTDYPGYFCDHGGAVLATTIDKYCYVSCRYLPPFFSEYRSRIVYSKMELTNDIDSIQHPAVRESLRFMNIAKGVEIHHDGDLPARTGLGSSSSFTVGLLNSLYALRGKIVSRKQLAIDAIHVEQKLIKENVGCQDQILASFGGFNLVEFNNGEQFRVQSLTLKAERLKHLQSHLMLIFTGFSRIASEIAAHLVKETPNKKVELKAIHDMVYEAVKILDDGDDITRFGRLLHEAWKVKRSLTQKITSPVIDQIYEAAMSAGALGGKLLGAGGGGFLLLFAKPEDHSKIENKLGKLLHVPFRFENSGSQIVFYREDEYDEAEP